MYSNRILSSKYLRSVRLGCKDIELIQFEFVAQQRLFALLPCDNDIYNDTFHLIRSVYRKNTALNVHQTFSHSCILEHF